MTGMKSSTIKLVLKNKVTDWANSITDPVVKSLVLKNTIVSGGAIASMLAGEKINDFDLYFRDINTVKALANYYVNKFNTDNALKQVSYVRSSCNPIVKEFVRTNIKGLKEHRIGIYVQSAGVASETQNTYEYFENLDETSSEEFVKSLDMNPLTVAEEIKEISKEKVKYRPVFFSENAITLTGKIQLVIRFYGEPEKIHSNYDFAHAMCYYDVSRDELSLHPEALEAILSKTLIYKGSLYPIASIFRTRKFIQRGWRITAGQMLKIIWQLSEIDLKDREVLREQLLGVDQAYMLQLLHVLESAEKNTKIDSIYLAKIIDEIFE